jgi:hypothetical protein
MQEQITREGETFTVETLSRSEGESNVDSDMQLLYRQSAICLTEPAIVLAYEAEQGIGTAYEGNTDTTTKIKKRAAALLQQDARKQAEAAEKERQANFSAEEKAAEALKKKQAQEKEKQESAAIDAHARALLAAKKTNQTPQGPAAIVQTMDV